MVRSSSITMPNLVGLRLFTPLGGGVKKFLSFVFFVCHAFKRFKFLNAMKALEYRFNVFGTVGWEGAYLCTGV